MSSLELLKSHLRKGKVYRRSELAQWSSAIDRDLDILLKEHIIEKLSTGLYYAPKTSVFGKVPPDEKVMIKAFLGDSKFLVVSPNLYNTLGVGTTQLYNRRIVYNQKRHGKFKLGNREFEFQIKHHSPGKLSKEFLLVDLANNINQLAEDRDEVLNRIQIKASQISSKKFSNMIANYGSTKTKKLFKAYL